eukprot:UC4_evm1s1179
MENSNVPSSSSSSVKRKAGDGDEYSAANYKRAVKRHHHSDERAALLQERAKNPGVVLTCGQNFTGQLGLDDNYPERKKPSTPQGLVDLNAFVRVCAGGMHTVALHKDGSVYTFGCNDEGACGFPGKSFEASCVPTKAHGLEGKYVVDISAGDCHTFVLTDQGEVLGSGTFRDENGPFGFSPSVEFQIGFST